MSAAGILTTPPDLPDESTIHIVPPDTFEHGPVALALRHWKKLKGDHRFPARDDISPRAMAPFLRNVVVIRVIDGGADFEFRIVGDAHVQAQGLNFGGSKLSTLEATIPDYNNYARATYGYVFSTGEPFGIHGWVGREVLHSAYSYYETVFLPLGRNGVVDHILVVTNYRPRPGQEFTPTIIRPQR